MIAKGLLFITEHASKCSPDGGARAWRLEERFVVPPPKRKRGPDEYVGAPLEGGEDGWCRPPVSGALPSHGLIRSTLGAGGLSFRVRNGSGRATPAMAADRWRRPPVPGGPRALGAAQRMERARPTDDPDVGRPTARDRAGPRAPWGARGRARAISTPRLSASPRLHLAPIDRVFYPALTGRRTDLGNGFPLRCLQRLSDPDAATRRCRWSTTGAPEVRPPRSSRTRGSLPRFSCARGG